MNTNWDSVSSKFDILFKISSFIFRSHFERKLFPKKKNTFRDICDHWIHYLGGWFIVIIIYTIIVYIFFVNPSDTSLYRIFDFGQRPIFDVIQEVYDKIKPTIFYNIVVLWVMYKALMAYAEKELLWDHFVHHKANGLIKVIKTGSFTSDSHLKEVDLELLNISRRHIIDLIEPEEKELISIVAPSGWDFFGEQITKLPNIENKNKLSWWKKILRIRETSIEPIPNGFLNDFLKNKTKRFEILLLNPSSDASKVRAQAYLKEGAHQVISDPKSYSENIIKVCEKLLLLKKINPNIEIRLIDKTPLFKIILTEGEAWAQPVIPMIRSDHVPMYGFKRGPFSLYHSFFSYNEMLWHNAVVLNDINQIK